MPESERLLGACFPPADSVGIEQQMAQVAGGEALAALPRTTGRMPSIPLLFPTYICTVCFFFPPSAEKKKKKKTCDTFLAGIYTSKYFLCVYSQDEMIFNELSVSENSSVNQQGCRQFLPYVGLHLYRRICFCEDQRSAFLSSLMC